MARPERNFREQLKRNLPRQGRQIHIMPVENTAVNGAPDLNIAVDGGIEVWCELKAWERVRFSGRFTVPKLREDQAAWLHKRASLGCRAYLLCRVNKDVVLIDGRYAPSLFDKSKHLEWSNSEVLFTWFRAPVKWDYLLDLLTLPPISSAQVEFGLAQFRARQAHELTEL